MIFSVYRDVRGEWRWRFVATNNKTIADSAEGYKNRQDCIDAIQLLKRSAAATPAYDVTVKPPEIVA